MHAVSGLCIAYTDGLLTVEVQRSSTKTENRLCVNTYREAVKSMTLPAVLCEQLRVQMEAVGIPLPESEARWLQAERAIIGVWASKFNDRAYFSMRKVGLNFMDLRMAVLVQRVVPADYAFVIHTMNPSSGALCRVVAMHCCC